MPGIMCVRQECIHRDRWGQCDSASCMVTLLHGDWKCNRYKGKDNGRESDERRAQGEQLSLPGGV